MRFQIALGSLLVLSYSENLLARGQTLSEYAKAHPLSTRAKGAVTVAGSSAPATTPSPATRDAVRQTDDPCAVSKISDLSVKPPATARLTEPVPVFNPKTPYPESLRRRRIQGDVVIAAIVACDGTLKDVTVLKAAHPELRSPAVGNVSTWRYKPATVDGQVRPMIVSLVVSFKLQ